MPYMPLTIPPGFSRAGTAYQVKGRWFDGNLIRWEGGRMRPVGGWRRTRDDLLSGVARGILSWRANNGARFLAIGTHTHLYAGDGSDFDDISPNDLVEGRVDSIEGLGYGAGPYGDDEYGTERSSTALVLAATVWSVDTWGENFVGVSSADGRILEWSLLGSSPAAAVSNAPTDNIGLLVTEERHLVALGANGNKRNVAWSDREDNTTWTPASTNQAGDLDLQTHGNIVCARRSRGEILIFTTVDLHRMSWLGGQFIYGIQRAGDKCGILGPNAVVALTDAAYWMGDGNFWVYDGYPKVLPSEVRDYVFGDFNRLQRQKIYAAHNSRFGEIWWFYCSSGSTENDRYVAYSYRDNYWAFGMLSRTCWEDWGVFQNPLALNAEGRVFQHEFGWTDDDESRNGILFAETGAIEMGAGDQVMVARQLIPDPCPNAQCTQVRFISQFTPFGPETDNGPYAVDFNSGYTPVRFTGRQFRYRVEQVIDSGWQLGDARLDVKAAGRR